METNVVNIWIYFTNTNTNVVLNFGTNEDMKMDIFVSE
jgi:hypothetical protein